MSDHIRKYLINIYCSNPDSIPYKVNKDFPVQIDDQDDSDNLNEYCNIFVTVRPKEKFEIDFCGNVPITQEIADLVDIYNGTYDVKTGRIVLELHRNQVGVLLDIAKAIHATAPLGTSMNNANWYKISARTVSSIYRFVRVIKEYTSAVDAGIF